MNRSDKQIARLVGTDDALERAYRTHERAATQFHKLAGTILGGLGVTLAAWLQRILEKPGLEPLNGLLRYLGWALLAVVVGFVLLTITTLLDKWSANIFASAVQINKIRMLTRIRISQLRRELPPGDARSAQELEQGVELQRLGVEAQARETRSLKINRWSQGLEIGTLACLAVAFGILAWGVQSTVYKGAALEGRAFDSTSGAGTLGPASDNAKAASAAVK